MSELCIVQLTQELEAGFLKMKLISAWLSREDLAMQVPTSLLTAL